MAMNDLMKLFRPRNVHEPMNERKTPCSECAFRPGADAHEEPYNRLRGMICAYGAVPFFCHHKVPWRDKIKMMAFNREMARQAGVCHGWRTQVGKLAASGFYGDGFLVIRREVAKQCLVAIDQFTGSRGKRRARLIKLLQAMVRFVCSRNIAHKKLPLLWG